MNTALERVQAVNNWLNSRIVGQKAFTQRLMMALLVGGHLLVEGAPGLAKTRAIKELSRGINGDFHRIQFTPDLLPSDVTGTEVYRPEDGTFEFKQGPIFHNLILADEVNRAPAKVQSALLEGMAEKQVTQGRETYQLPELFLVMATQNPIEQEGTYPLPEAQLDRFLMHINVSYPEVDQEIDILRINRNDLLQNEEPPSVILEQNEIFDIRRQLSELYITESLEQYIVSLVVFTRTKLENVEYGASPRATIALDQAARAMAWLDSRDFVSPDDIQTVLHDVLRHRIILRYTAEAKGYTPQNAIDDTLNAIPVP